MRYNDKVYKVTTYRHLNADNKFVTFITSKENETIDITNDNFDINSLEPIELDYEILFDNFGQVGGKGFFTGEGEEIPFEKDSFALDDKHLLTKHVNDWIIQGDNVTIRYVHQLQKRYNEITGQELRIELQ